ncbi:hypothetical protein M5585_16840 [Serratia ureilytica]
MAGDNRAQRRENIEMKRLCGDGPGHDRQRRNIGAKPQGKQAAGMAMTLPAGTKSIDLSSINAVCSG